VKAPVTSLALACSLHRVEALNWITILAVPQVRLASLSTFEAMIASGACALSIVTLVAVIPDAALVAYVFRME